jgi:hypothetical protein
MATGGKAAPESACTACSCWSSLSIHCWSLLVRVLSSITCALVRGAQQCAALPAGSIFLMKQQGAVTRAAWRLRGVAL